MLYPLTVAPDPVRPNQYVIPNGNLYAFPFTVAEGEAVNVVVAHTGIGKQDHSLRVWVSAEPGHNPVVDRPIHVVNWYPNRDAREYVTVYDSALAPPTVPGPLAVQPGTYFVNVLNLTNSENSFAFELTDLV